jgi:YfiH family protein
MFYFENINGKRILKSDFIKDVQAFFTTRDLCICDKENMENPQIFEDKNIIADYLKIDEKNLVYPEQTHSANIDVAIETNHAYPNCDALILTNKTQAIFLNFADCTPIILYDKVQNIGAIAHAGWRGTAQKIAPLTAQKLCENFGSKMENLIALIGPAIGFCCYNVGQEVYEKLSKTVTNFDGLFEIKNDEIFVDLK